jgi:hypothetical protein
MAQLPRVAGSLSDAAKLKFSNINSQLAEMVFLNVITDDFANLNNWTEVDSGSNVNLSGGEVSLNGSGAYAANGIYYTSGITTAPGYFELKFKLKNVANSFEFQLAQTAAIPTGRAVPGSSIINALQLSVDNFINQTVCELLSADIYYTIRFYIHKRIADSSNRGFRVTISGGSWSSETELYNIEYLTTALAATIYPCVQRYLNNSSNLTYVKEFRWYSGYATDAPYVTYTHDAGAGKVFDNFDPSALAMPGSVPSTNLTFKWSFDDGVASYSSALTLAQLNAVGKQTARHRYIRLQVLLNSDGATQVYADKPNSDTATDGVGDFPDVGNVRPPDTVQGTTGDLSNLVATDAAYTTLENSRNNDNGTVAADIATRKSVKIRNTTTNGASDKIYSADDELARNFGLTAAKMLTSQSATQRGNLVEGSAPIAESFIEWITPSYGPTAGGTAFQVSVVLADGKTLEGCTANIDGVPCTGVSVSGSLVDAVSPAGISGGATIYVVLADTTEISLGAWLYTDKALTLAEEQVRNTALAAKYQLGETFKKWNVDAVGEYAGGGVTVPAAPTGVAGTALSSTSVRLSCAFSPTATGIDWYECSNAAGDNPSILANMPAAALTHDVTGLTAVSTHYYKAKARNSAGQSAAFSTVVTVTTMASLDILTRIETNGRALIETMTRANGYRFDWPEADNEDLAKSDIATDGSDAAAWFELVQDEEAVDASESYDSSSYHNRTKVRIHSAAYLASVGDNPKNDYRALCGKMIEDLKKLFGMNGTPTAQHIAFWNDIGTMNYADSRVEWFPDGSANMPGKLITEWTITYAQLRTDPSQSAL